MRMTRKFILTCIILVLAPAVVIAQSTNECAAYVARGLSSVGSNCANLQQGEVCYGYGDASATLFDEAQGLTNIEAGSEFDGVADRLQIMSGDMVLETITTGPLSVPEDTLGVSLAYVAASQHPSADPRGVSIMQFGNLRVENGVQPDEMVIYGNTVNVTVEDATLYTYPPEWNVVDEYTYPNEIIAVENGAQSYTIDGVDASGQWVRVQYDYDNPIGTIPTAWMLATQLPDGTDLSGVATLGPRNFAPMAKFYLVPQAGNPSCSGDGVPPTGVLVQAADGTATDIMVNDVPIRLFSTAYLEPLNGAMRIHALTGFVVLHPEQNTNNNSAAIPQQTIIPAGFSKQVCLETGLNLGLDGEPNDASETFPCNTEVELSNALDRLRGFNNLPGNLFRTVSVPSVLTPSGVGEVVRQLLIGDPATRARVQELCDQGLLPPGICRIANR